MPVISISLSIGYPGATRQGELEIPQKEWDACETEDDQIELMAQYANEWANEFIDLGFELVEGAEHD